MRFDGQAVLITGAGSGIGAAAAKMFAARGANLLLNDLNADICDEVVHAVERIGGAACVVPGDVTKPDTPQRLISQAIERFGGLNVLVNNAGFTWDGMLHKMSDVQWQQIQDLHTTAPFRLIRAVAQVWRPLAKAELAEGRAHPPRSIVNVSSTSGLHGNTGQINYATAKMGVIGMTKTVAREWGPLGIRCNAVAFGFIDTRLTQSTDAGHTMDVAGHSITLGIPSVVREAAFTNIPMGRPGTAEEAAAGILLMASSLSSYITGHTLEVTGGLGI